jgi:thiamine biosynthesis lipoprotein
MNTDLDFQVADWRHAHLLPRAETLVHALEARFSRFRPDSELSFLNNRSTATVAVSDLMLTLLQAAKRFHKLTGGLFEPAILEQLEASGYDTSFEQLRGRTVTARQTSRPRVGISDLEVDTASGRVVLQPGVRLDLGGIAKGFIVDQVSTLLSPAADYLVDAGGDIYAAGRGADGRPWRVGVADPFDASRHVQIVEISAAAIATSSVMSRRWRTSTGSANHIIDPRTGQSIENGVACVTVVAPQAVAADVFAKTALILDPLEGSQFLESQAAHGLFVMADGCLRPTRHWPGTNV